MRNLNFLTVTILGVSLAWAQTSEKERLSGFAEHQKRQTRFEEARMQGERAYFEYEEQWENKKKRDLEQYKSTKKQIVMDEDGPEAKADELAKRKYAEAYEESQQEYLEQRSKKEIISRQALNLPTEEQELGLDQLRPRYDYKKRAYFTGKSSFGKSNSSSGGGSSSSGGFGGSGSFGGGGSSFPPPPTFDDFNDGGFVPAPNVSDDFGDVPPPPPPPPPPFGDDSEFPPPPISTPFGGEGADF